MKRSFALPLAFAGVLALIVPATAGAGTLDSVTMPATETVNGQVLHLNGMGLRTYTFFRVHIWVAGLYVPTPSHDAATILDEPGTKMVVIEYRHSGSKSQVEHQLRDSEEKNCVGGCPAAGTKEMEQLIAVSPAIKPGDVTTYVFAPTGFTAYFNNKELGSWPDPKFSRAILNGFIGSRPPQESVRAGLLGLSP